MLCCSVPQEKRTFSKEELQALLDADPNTTIQKMGRILSCGKQALTRELSRHGLRTRKWGERKHTLETRTKISQHHIENGVAKGERNPNYGSKPRPWLEGENNALRRWHQGHPEFGVNQRGVENPIHKVKHLYQDPSYVANITRGIRAHVKSKTGKSYEEVYGVSKAMEYKDKLRAASPVRMSKFKRKVTKPELIVRSLLQGLGVSFVEQAILGPYTVDFLIPDSRLVVQADGDYWHANPEVYPNDDNLSKSQQKQRRLDASCNSLIRNKGYVLVRLWESDLHQNQEKCAEILCEALKMRNR